MRKYIFYPFLVLVSALLLAACTSFNFVDYKGVVCDFVIFNPDSVEYTFTSELPSYCAEEGLVEYEDFTSSEPLVWLQFETSMASNAEGYDASLPHSVEASISRVTGDGRCDVYVVRHDKVPDSENPLCSDDPRIQYSPTVLPRDVINWLRENNTFKFVMGEADSSRSIIMYNLQ